jgi:hypothetical protein
MPDVAEIGEDSLCMTLGCRMQGCMSRIISMRTGPSSALLANMLFQYPAALRNLFRIYFLITRTTFTFARPHARGIGVIGVLGLCAGDSTA